MTEEEAKRRKHREGPVGYGWLPAVHFGPPGAQVEGKPLGEEDPDDEELDETPPDVVRMLGFDPADGEG